MRLVATTPATPQYSGHTELPSDSRMAATTAVLEWPLGKLVVSGMRIL